MPSCWQLPSSETHGAAVVQMLFERRVDGIIVAPPQLEEDFEFVGLFGAPCRP